METDPHGPVYSDLAIPPGETLADEIEARGMTQKELAARLDRPAQVVNEIIRGRKAITNETALGLEKVLGIGATFWTNLEHDYQMTRAKLRERELLIAQKGWLSDLPVREMEKRAWISTGRNAEEKVRELLRFFGVATVPAYHSTTEVLGFRSSDHARVSSGSLAAWLRKGELDAMNIKTRQFDATRLLEAAHIARGLTNEGPEVFAPRLKQLFAEAGVAFIVVRELPKTGANGVARWLTDQKVLIQLNLRYKWQDIFWFTLFHEVAHLLHHRNQRIIIDGIHKHEAREAEADQWAADFLVPNNAWTLFSSSKSFTRHTITELARQQKISPGIVVGRLQREGHLKYSQHQNLKRQYRWIDD